MTWQPTKQVIDVTQIADNLLGYIETNDADALAWAKGDALPEFAAFYTNASGRLQTIFPSLMILSQAVESDLKGDVLIAGLQLVLEGTISGSDPNTLVADTKAYAKAVESMIENIPSDALTTDSDPAMHAALYEIETRLDIIRGQQTPSAFLQIFQVQCLFSLTTHAY